MFTGDWLAKREDNPKKVIGLFAGFFIGCQLLSTFTENFWVYAFLFIISFGVCHGSLFLYSIRLAQQFYPKKKYLVQTVVLSGYGIGTFVFDYTSTLIVNADD